MTSMSVITDAYSRQAIVQGGLTIAHWRHPANPASFNREVEAAVSYVAQHLTMQERNIVINSGGNLSFYSETLKARLLMGYPLDVVVAILLVATHHIVAFS